MGDDQLKGTLRHLVSVIVTLSQGMVLASPSEVQGILKQGAVVPSAINLLFDVLESSTNVFSRFDQSPFFCDMGWPSGHGQVANPGHPLVCHGQVRAHRTAVREPRCLTPDLTVSPCIQVSACNRSRQPACADRTRCGDCGVSVKQLWVRFWCACNPPEVVKSTLVDVSGFMDLCRGGVASAASGYSDPSLQKVS